MYGYGKKRLNSIRCIGPGSQGANIAWWLCLPTEYRSSSVRPHLGRPCLSFVSDIITIVETVLGLTSFAVRHVLRCMLRIRRPEHGTGMPVLSHRKRPVRHPGATVGPKNWQFHVPPKRCLCCNLRSADRHHQNETYQTMQVCTIGERLRAYGRGSWAVIWYAIRRTTESSIASAIGALHADLLIISVS